LAIDKTRKDWRAKKRAALAAAVRRVVMVLVLGVLIVSALYLYDYLTTSDAFTVAEVELRGVTRIEDAELRRMLSDLEGHNLFLAPLDDLEKRLEMHPRVEEVDMRRVVPDRIVCDVSEREPVALVFTDRFLEVDRHGMIMAEDAYTPLLDLPIITGVSGDDVNTGHISESEDVRRALEVLRVAREIGGEFASAISEVNVERGGVVVRSLENDRVLVLGEGDYENRLRKYFVLHDELDRETSRRVVDLRFQDQVVLRASL
jgi:cell division protein FtsQ